MRHFFQLLFIGALPVWLASTGCAAEGMDPSRGAPALFKLQQSQLTEADVNAAAQKSAAGGAEAALAEAPPLMVGAKNQRLSIFKKALGREFLLRVSSIFPGPIPSFRNSATRIVVFKKIAKKLVMFDVPDRYLVNQDDIALDFILAEFQIVSEDSNSLSFDFNAGMSQHFLYATSWWASDIYSPSWRDHFMAADVRYSYLAEAKLLKSGRAFIRQVAQLELGVLPLRMPVEVRYFLEPYKANPDFKPSKGGRFNKSGYFEVAPQYKRHGGQDVLATKFDTSKPVVFAVSANTPAEYREAVREGVLYWNRAFGREVLSVVDAPEDVAPPHPDYNIIQWVNWDNFGLAYADAQHDPRTGEILNAQVWLSSAWAAMTKRRVRIELEAQNEAEDKSEDKSEDKDDNTQADEHMHGWPQGHQAPWASPSVAISLKGFEHRPLCLYNASAIWKDFLLQLSRISTDEGILAATQDAVRDVTAHEVGHVLGLRHNFAGSLAINYSPAQRRWYLNEYLKSFKAPKGAVPSSSVMDYLASVEMFLAGRQIHEEAPALAYDKYAIEQLYQLNQPDVKTADKADAQVEVEAKSKAKTKTEANKADKKEEPQSEVDKIINSMTPLFCTDTHVWRFVDCSLYDVYTGPREARDVFARTLENLPRWILERFASVKDPAPWQPRLTMQEVGLWPSIYASALLRGQQSFLTLLTKKGRLLSVERSFEVVDDLNSERIEHITDELVAQQVQVNGGLGQVLALFDPDFVSIQVRRVENLLNKVYKKGVGPGGHEYEFDDNELKFILEKAKQFYRVLQEKTEKQYLKNFVNLKDIKETPVAMNLAQFLRDIARHYLLSVQDNEFIQGSLKKEEVLIPIDAPVLTYDFETRKLAARLLHGARTNSLFWGNAERVYLRKEYKDFVTDVFKGETFEAIEAENISPDLLTWYWEQKTLLTLL